MKLSKASLLGIITIVILLLGLPLLGPKFIPTHDGEYHLIRFMEFYSMLSQGYLFPRWAPTLNSGFGIPIFLFHYPFPNYIGSLFHVLGFQFVDAFKMALFSGYFLSGVFCFIFLSKIVDKRASFFGTIAALTVPYWFVDIYVRGSVGEVWAFAWMFAALACVVWQKNLGLGVSIAFLVLSHNIQALLFLPIITIFAFVRYRAGLVAIALGLLLSAYFWIPALLERSYVVGLSTVNPLDHFASIWELLVPSWGTEFSGQSIIANKMSFQIGVMPLVWLGLAIWFMLRNKLKNSFVSVALILAALAAFLMLPYSGGIWSTIAGIAYIQYPWRLLALFIPIVAVVAGIVSTKLSIKILIGMSFVSLLLVYGYTRPVLYERRDDGYYSSKPNFTDGTSSMGNAFSTIWTPWKPQRPEKLIEQDQGVMVTMVDQKPLFVKFIAESAKESTVRVNILYFPGWTAYRDTEKISIAYENDGLINLQLPMGTHEVVVRFEETPVRAVANAISLMGLLWLSVWAILKCIYAYRHKYRSHVRRTQ
jgi:hypothetical protein